MGIHNTMDIESLLTRYLDKNCSTDEKQQIYDLLISSDGEKSFKEILFSNLNNFNEYSVEDQPPDFDYIYDKILIELKLREERVYEKRLLKNRIKVRRIIFQGLSIAAVFYLSFFLGGLYYRQHAAPASHGGPYEAAFSEIKAPLGAKSEINLSDGTQVILNAGSTLKYGSDYNTANRDLKLEGEAYFKVARNAAMPLIVTAGNLNIKATGTEFNVKAYSDESVVETTLIEGKIEISQKGDNNKDAVLELEPNQKAIYTSELDQITLEKIRESEPLAIQPANVAMDKLLVSPKTDIDQVTAWTKNKLIIRSENLENLCVKLQRKYDVTFVFGSEEIKKYRFTGVLLDETFEQVMNVIKLTAPVDYLLDGKTVVMFSNKEQSEKYSKYLKKNKN